MHSRSRPSAIARERERNIHTLYLSLLPTLTSRTSSLAPPFDGVSAAEETSDVGGGVKVEDLEAISTVDEALEKLVRKRIVHALRPDVLAANCCWENAVLWNKFVEGHLPASPDVSN